MRFDSMTPLQLDALREVGGIGAGHAATALSQLVDRPIALQVPTLEIVDVVDVPRAFGGPEQLVVAVYARLLGDLTGGVMFVAGREDVLALVDLLRGHEIGTAAVFGHDEEALLRHAATILISAYLSAIARLADLDVLPTSPVLAFDMAGALIEAVVTEVGLAAEQAVFVRASFIEESATVAAGLLFVPSPSSFEVLLGRLGVA